MKAQIYNEDCFDVISRLEDNSIDLVVTDPPYWHKKGHYKNNASMTPTTSKFANSNLYKTGQTGNSMLGDMSDFTDKEINKLLDTLKPKFKSFNGYFYCSESQVPYYCLWAEENKLLFSILVWEKPLSIINKNRFSQNLEYIVRIYKGRGLNRLDNNEYYSKIDKSKPIVGKKKRHPTEKPNSVFEKYILISSNEGDTVFDPFMGSGVCGEVATRFNRKFIGCEINSDFFDIAKTRIEQAEYQASIDL